MVDRVVRGGDTLLGCEAARSSMTLECFPVGEWFEGLWGVWLVLPGPSWRECVGGVGVGLFLENCIVDASIL